jgi:hypothetical protein
MEILGHLAVICIKMDSRTSPLVQRLVHQQVIITKLSHGNQEKMGTTEILLR